MKSLANNRDGEPVGEVVLYPPDMKIGEKDAVESRLAPVVSSVEELQDLFGSMNESVTKVATSGYFNPLHKNHISNIVSSKYLPVELLESLNLSPEIHLTVVVNGDWSTRNKLGGGVFMTAEHRADVVRAIVGVDLVFINEVETHHQGALIELGIFHVFTKGGDRDFASLPVPEQKAMTATRTIMIGDVGYEKLEGTKDEVSSSKLRQFARDNT